MATTNLPQELIDQAIDHLHDDEAALRSCSLVCRAWIETSRCHLFGTVHLTSQNCPRFVEVLRQSPHIQQHVRHVKFAMMGDPDEMLQYMGYALRLPALLRSFVEDVVPKLHTVESLTLVNVGFDSQATSPMTDHLRRVKALTLINCRVSRWHDIHEFLQEHPAMIDFGCCRLRFRHPSLVAGTNHRPTIKTLRLLAPLNQDELSASVLRFYRWILERGSVETLVVQIGSNGDIWTLNSLFSLAGGVSRLEIVLDTISVDLPRFAPVQLDSLTMIQVTIKSRKTLKWAFTSLISLKAPLLQKLYFMVFVTLFEEDWRWMRWASLDAILSELHQLKTFNVLCIPRQDDFVAAIQGGLPLTYSKGLMSFAWA